MKKVILVYFEEFTSGSSLKMQMKTLGQISVISAMWFWHVVMLKYPITQADTSTIRDNLRNIVI